MKTMKTDDNNQIEQVFPYLRTHDASAAIKFYEQAFGELEAQRQSGVLDEQQLREQFMKLEENEVRAAFREKEIDPDEWVNGAFFVLEPAVLDRIEGDATQFEHEPLRSLARDGELHAYRHEGFWQCMDTLKEAQTLNALWEQGAAPWTIWERDDARIGNGQSGLHRQHSGADAASGWA